MTENRHPAVGLADATAEAVMKLLFAFFADAASLQSDGIFSVLRGGLETLTSPVFPASSPNLALIWRVSFEPAECDRDYQCSIQVSDPNGNLLTPDLTYTARPTLHKRHAELPSPFTFYYRYDGFTVYTTGFYTFRFYIDGKEIGHEVLESIQGPLS